MGLTIWTSEEIDLDVDIKDWEKLNRDEKHCIQRIVAFFAASDGIVNENFALRFYDDVRSTCILFFSNGNGNHTLRNLQFVNRHVNKGSR